MKPNIKLLKRYTMWKFIWIKELNLIEVIVEDFLIHNDQWETKIRRPRILIFLNDEAFIE